MIYSTLEVFVLFQNSMSDKLRKRAKLFSSCIICRNSTICAKLIRYANRIFISRRALSTLHSSFRPSIHCIIIWSIYRFRRHFPGRCNPFGQHQTKNEISKDLFRSSHLFPVTYVVMKNSNYSFTLNLGEWKETEVFFQSDILDMIWLSFSFEPLYVAWFTFPYCRVYSSSACWCKFEHFLSFEQFAYLLVKDGIIARYSS